MPSSTFHDAERRAIIEALRACSGRMAGCGGAAERLGLKRTTLQRKMSRLNVSRSDYNPEPGKYPPAKRLFESLSQLGKSWEDAPRGERGHFSWVSFKARGGRRARCFR